MKYSPVTTEETQLFRGRLLIIVALVGLVFLVWVFRLWQLQIMQGSYYEEVSRGNRIRVVPQAAPRGIIYDREGKILAYNRPAFDIQIILEDTPDVRNTMENLSRVTDIPLPHLENILDENRRGPKFKPIVLLRDIGRKTADLVDTYQDDLPGITVAVEPKRLYPAAYFSSHLVGYVGIINEEQLKALPINQLYSGRVVGQSGVELISNTNLIGLDGGRQIEVDHLGRELRVLSKPVNPVPGNDIYLTIDLELQRHVHQLMAGKNGVVIVSRPRTGEILSMASFPDFDPNLFIGGIQDQAWRRITRGEEKPLINKAVQGLYPPGSTFKMVIAAAALHAGHINEDTTLNCPGYYRVGKDIRHCWKRSGHGDVTVREALEQSCNVFFYQLGMMLGVDSISEYSRMFGFGQLTDVELESEKTGLIPTREWKERVYKDRWYDGETPSVAIGQGYVLVTPLQLLNYMNTVANGGLQVQPTILRRVVSPLGRTLLGEEELPRKAHLLPIELEVFNIIREGLVQAVNNKGTAFRAGSKNFTVAGKTGTSQVVGRKSIRNIEKDDLDESLLPHSLFVGYAPAEAPRVSVLVLVEHGSDGGKIAAPLARKVLEFYDKNVESLHFDQIKLPEISDDSARGTPGADNFRRELALAFSRDEHGLDEHGLGSHDSESHDSDSHDSNSHDSNSHDSNSHDSNSPAP
ncbi:MAG: penicillin-binding protein 2, partial [Deltaproteobacteria bacterium]|nr:penicillin-binding protein 2 [Deltaproteobacteria bacterium]